jgi:signal transduction histidine kinase
VGEAGVAPDIAIAPPDAPRELWVTFRAAPLHNAQGEIVGVIGTTQDITERKRAEIALRSYVARLENLRGIDQAIRSAHSSEGLAETAIRQLEALLPCWAGGVFVFDFDRDEVESISSIGRFRELFPSGARVPTDLKNHPEVPGLRASLTSYYADIEGVDLRGRPVLEKFRAAGLRSYIYMPLIDRGNLIGVLALGSDRPDAFSSDHIEIAREVSDHLAIALSRAFLLEENQSAKKRLESLSRRLIQAEEDQRRRIARELHDEIGQALTALKINVQEVVGGNGDDRRRLAESAGIVEQVLQQVRGMALDLRPSLLDDLGLAPALQWYVRRQAERTGLYGRFVAEPEHIEADSEIASACFRVAQEALTNVARHAQARRFSVELLKHSGGLQLVVRDDGVGFDHHEALNQAIHGASFGLLGMRERVELVGGELAFVSGPGIGTEVHVDFPNTPVGTHGSARPDSALEREA